MLGVTVIALALLVVNHVAIATYDPARDDDISTTDDSVIVMQDGRPNMKQFQNLVEKQDIREDEEAFEEVGIPPEELTEEEKQEELEGVVENNRRRFIINGPHHLWDFGILPYKFDAALPISSQKNIKEVVIPKYEYWTHFRFPEWNNSVPQLYNLSHHNYLLFTSEHGCWSHVGCNKHGHGQKLSCCKGNACVHEIGHSIGFHHEQSNPLRDDFIRIDYENILDGKAGNFGKSSLSGNRIFGYFDIASIMEYGSMAFNKNKKETITVFDPDLLYFLQHQDTSAFYMFYEAQTQYKMKDQMCPDFPIQCINDGYVSYINNTCQCRCPTGMDSSTGCATPLRGDIWPEGEYSIFAPESGCPSGFIPGELKLLKNMARNVTITPSTGFHVAGSFSKRYATLKFCTKRYPHMPGTASQWTAGNYCVLKTSSACPKDFTVEHMNLGPDGAFASFSKTGIVPDFQSHSNFSLTACCRQDGHLHTAINLPSQKPFVLLSNNGHGCQKISGMNTHQESISWTSAVNNNRQTMALCYYSAMKDNTESCGDMIYLSDSNPIVHVTSPNYPSDYNGTHPCSWFVKGPDNSKILMEFTDFSIQNAQDCNGHIELRYYLPGEHGMTYCGRGFNKTIISNFETLYMILTPPTPNHHKRFLLTPSGSGSASDHAARRFNVTFKLIKESDLCYTQQGKDNSYQGKINYGRNFERCLPWDKVPNCQHNIFNEVEHDLEGNFCQNPGFGTEPWCYTNAETCHRAYCDSCQLRRCYDLFSDCAKEIHKDKSYCSDNPEASRGCRQSCGMCEAVPKTSPVSIKTCRTPSLTLPDGKAIGKLKGYYRVGENVKYACNVDGNETHIITCSSEGTWTHLSYACGGCPHSWRLFDGYCYKYIGSRQKKAAAIQRCQQEKHGAIISPAESEDEMKLLRSMAGHASIWLGGHSHVSHGHKDLVWEDGHAVNYTHWLNDTAWPHKGNRNCVILTPNKVWDNTNCAYKNTFVCRAVATATQVCLDQRTDCSLLIDRTPDLCVKYAHTFARLKCAKSCGLCTNKGYVNTGICRVTEQPGNATLVSSSSTYKVGSVVKYSCNVGYHLAHGDLVRACKLSGTLSGSTPVCLAIDDTVSEVGDADIRRRHKVGAARTAYAFSNKYNRIQRSGEIIAWRFYSNHGGEVAFQVWRQLGNTTHYKLTGQNIIPNTLNDREVTVNITKSERITVQPGDFIGVFFPRTNHGGITYDVCKITYDPEGGDDLQSTFKPYKVTNWVVGHQYGMKPTAACWLFSLKAFIGPV